MSDHGYRDCCVVFAVGCCFISASSHGSLTSADVVEVVAGLLAVGRDSGNFGGVALCELDFLDLKLKLSYCEKKKDGWG